MFHMTALFSLRHLPVQFLFHFQISFAVKRFCTYANKMTFYAGWTYKRICTQIHKVYIQVTKMWLEYCYGMEPTSMLLTRIRNRHFTMVSQGVSSYSVLSLFFLFLPLITISFIENSPYMKCSIYLLCILSEFFYNFSKTYRWIAYSRFIIKGRSIKKH